jgi:hypothetical protein
MSSLIQPKNSSATPSGVSKRCTYSSSTLQRASRALSCAPFRLKLFLTMIVESVPLPLMAGKLGVERNYTDKILSENAVERELMWLIAVGLLRREVDGQGITDSFRLTPLGKNFVNQWQKNPGEIPTPSFGDRLANFLARWFRLPI